MKTSGVVTTQNLSGQEIPKRLKIGGTKPISFLKRDKMALMSPKKFNREEEENEVEVKDVEDILNRVKSKVKK